MLGGKPQKHMIEGIVKIRELTSNMWYLILGKYLSQKTLSNRGTSCHCLPNYWVNNIHFIQPIHYKIPFSTLTLQKVIRSCVPKFWEKTAPWPIPSLINISLVWPMGHLFIHLLDPNRLIGYIYFSDTLLPRSSESVWKTIVHHFIHPEHYLYAAYFSSQCKLMRSTELSYCLVVVSLYQ